VFLADDNVIVRVEQLDPDRLEGLAALHRREDDAERRACRGASRGRRARRR